MRVSLFLLQCWFYGSVLRATFWQLLYFIGAGGGRGPVAATAAPIFLCFSFFSLSHSLFLFCLYFNKTPLSRSPFQCVQASLCTDYSPVCTLRHSVGRIFVSSNCTVLFFFTVCSLVLQCLLAPLFLVSVSVTFESTLTLPLIFLFRIFLHISITFYVNRLRVH